MPREDIVGRPRRPAYKPSKDLADGIDESDSTEDINPDNSDFDIDAKL
jgi:hypothetical protein|tara:strand:- start:6108 stop:6251 length:144 start_codon:yes stop_codon:yes gene_type:complete